MAQSVLVSWHLQEPGETNGSSVGESQPYKGDKWQSGPLMKQLGKGAGASGTETTRAHKVHTRGDIEPLPATIQVKRVVAAPVAGGWGLKSVGRTRCALRESPGIVQNWPLKRRHCQKRH